MSLSEVLDDYGKGVSAWAATSKKALLAVHRLQRAVVDGNVRDTEKLRQAAVQAAATAAEQADESQPLVFDAGAYLTGSGAFLEEIQDAAERAGVQLYVRNGLIFCYPVIVTPEPALSAVRVDKRLDPSIRPDALAAVLKKAQSKEPRDRPDQFIESLFAAYDIVEMERARYEVEEHRLVCVSAVRVFTTLAATGRVYEFETTGRIILCRFSSVAGPGLAVVGQDRLVDYRQTRR